MHSSGKQTPLRAPFVIVSFLQLLKRGCAGLLLHHPRILGTALCCSLQEVGGGCHARRNIPSCRAGHEKGYFASPPAHCLPSENSIFGPCLGISKQKFRALPWRGQTFLPKDAVGTNKLDTGANCYSPCCPLLKKEHQIPRPRAPVAVALLVLRHLRDIK